MQWQISQRRWKLLSLGIMPSAYVEVFTLSLTWKNWWFCQVLLSLSLHLLGTESVTKSVFEVLPLEHATWAYKYFWNELCPPWSPRSLTVAKISVSWSLWISCKLWICSWLGDGLSNYELHEKSCHQTQSYTHLHLFILVPSPSGTLFQTGTVNLVHTTVTCFTTKSTFLLINMHVHIWQVALLEQIPCISASPTPVQCSRFIRNQNQG